MKLNAKGIWWLILFVCLILLSCQTTQTTRYDKAKNYYEQGKTFANKGQYDQAIQAFTKYIELTPEAHFGAYYYRGVCSFNKGLYDAAISDFNHTIKVQPDYAGAYWAKALACEKVNRIDAAIEAYRFFIQYGVSKEDQSRVQQAWQRIDELRSKSR